MGSACWPSEEARGPAGGTGRRRGLLCPSSHLQASHRRPGQGRQGLGRGASREDAQGTESGLQKARRGWDPEASRGQVQQEEGETAHRTPGSHLQVLRGEREGPICQTPRVCVWLCANAGCLLEQDAGPAAGPERTGHSRQGLGTVVFPREPQATVALAGWQRWREQVSCRGDGPGGHSSP